METTCAWSILGFSVTSKAHFSNSHCSKLSSCLVKCRTWREGKKYAASWYGSCKLPPQEPCFTSKSSAGSGKRRHYTGAPWPPEECHGGSRPMRHKHAYIWLDMEKNLQFSSVTQSCPTLCDPTNCSTPGLPVHHQLLKFAQTHVHRVGDAIQPSHPLSSPPPPAPNPSQHQGLFQWVNSSHEVAKVLEFPSNEHPGLISFRTDWLDLLAVQGTLKSLLQHHSSKPSILQRSAFFTVQLSHPYMTPGKTIALTRRTFISKVISLLLNMLSRLVITFLPRSKHLLISIRVEIRNYLLGNFPPQHPIFPLRLLFCIEQLLPEFLFQN